MKLHVITLVLNGMPWLPAIFTALQGVKRIEWVWHVSHGTAFPAGCTSWCKRQPPRLSRDGTTEFLESIQPHPNVRVYESKEWPGKLAMVNNGMDVVQPGDVVMEMDSDELWTPQQIELVCQLFKADPRFNAMEFLCRYFVGPNLILQGNGYGNKPGEWRRAWRAGEGFKFTQHEPPEVNEPRVVMTREATASLGLIFDHYAYATEAQVAWKERYYGYADAVNQWRDLQAASEFPVEASKYLQWIKDHVQVVRVHG